MSEYERERDPSICHDVSLDVVCEFNCKCGGITSPVEQGSLSPQTQHYIIVSYLVPGKLKARLTENELTDKVIDIPV